MLANADGARRSLLPCAVALVSVRALRKATPDANASTVASKRVGCVEDSCAACIGRPASLTVCRIQRASGQIVSAPLGPLKATAVSGSDVAQTYGRTTLRK